MARTRYRIFDNDYPHFLTCAAVGWLPVFTRPAAVQIVFDSWTYLVAHNRLTIFGYVVMENHLHLIASSEALGKEIGDFKSFTARKIIDHLRHCGDEPLLKQLHLLKDKHKDDRSHQLWQEGSHPQQIQGDEMMLQKLEYIHNNPVRRGFVALPEHWIRSSASNYLGLPSVFPVQTEW
jgi:putative transposase